MGISLISTTADGEALGAFMIPPVTRGLKLLTFTGLDENRSKRNRAGLLLAAATKNGSPVFNSDRMSGSNLSNNLSFPIDEPLNCSIIIMGRPEAADQSIAGNRSGFCGWYQNGATVEGAGLFVGGATLIRASGTYNDAGSNVAGTSSYGSYSSAEIDDPRALAAVYTYGTGHQLYDLTKNVLGNAAVASWTTNRVVSPSGRTFKVGALNGGNNGPQTTYAAMVADVAWTKSEVDQNAAWMATFLKNNRSINGLIPGV